MGSNDSAAGAITEVVLVVDDDESFREVLGDLIVDEGLSVATATNGREALDLLESGLRPIAICLDIMMPVMDGAVFRAAQLGMPEARAIPVAVLSASGTSRQQVTAQFGDVAYLPKPTTSAAIVAFLDRCRPSRPTSSRH